MLPQLLKHPVIIGLGAGLLGVVLGLVGWHLWQDHQTLHALVNLAVEQAQKK